MIKRQLAVFHDASVDKKLPFCNSLTNVWGSPYFLSGHTVNTVRCKTNFKVSQSPIDFSMKNPKVETIDDARTWGR